MYDGQEELVDAVKAIIDANIQSDKINKDTIKNYLYTRDFPEVDYIIRTGMEDGARISGFFSNPSPPHLFTSKVYIEFTIY